MVEITARYEGDLRCSAVHGPSKSTLLTDAPVDNHGREKPSRRPISSRPRFPRA